MNGTNFQFKQVNFLQVQSAANKNGISYTKILEIFRSPKLPEYLAELNKASQTFTDIKEAIGVFDGSYGSSEFTVAEREAGFDIVRLATRETIHHLKQVHDSLERKRMFEREQLLSTLVYLKFSFLWSIPERQPA